MRDSLPLVAEAASDTAGAGRRPLRRGLVAAVAGAAVLAYLPFLGLPREWMLYLFLYFVYLAMAKMWNLLAGYSGLVSLCQAAFVGIAGYTLVILTWLEVPWFVGLAAGAVAAAGFALLISVPVFRLSGTYFAIGTLVVPEAVRIVFLQWRPVGGALAGGGAGYSLKGASELSMAGFYWLALAAAAISVVTVSLVLGSRLGLGLAAVRDNQRSAASLGVDVFALKVRVFAISAAITGLAGGVFFLYQRYIEPASAFNISWTMTLILAVVIGGMRTEAGPFVGTAIVVFLRFALAAYAGVSLLIQGLILILVMLVMPRGVVGFLQQRAVYRRVARLISG